MKKPSAAKPTQGSQDSAQAVVDRAAPAGAPRAAAPPGGAPAGPPTSGPAFGGPAGPPTGAAPTRPPAAAAPAASRPPAAAAPAPRPAPQKSAPAAEPAKPRVPQANIQLDDEDLKAAGNATFSPMVMGLLGAVLLVGVGFGWAASTSLANSEIYNTQTADGARIHGALEPKVAEFQKAKGMVAKLSATEPDFESAKALAALDFTADGNLMGGGRLLLGSKLISDLTGYSVDAAMLTELLADHDNMTNNVDKQELEAISQNNELLDKDRFAVLFDFNYLAKNNTSDTYSPRPGRLVNVLSMEKDEEGKVEVSYLNSSKTSKTLLQGLVPLEKGELLKSDGPNALQRYQKRVDRIKKMSDRLDNRVNPLMSSLKTLGERDKAGLF
ncbi:hypothetical protein DN745_07180 [Bradymonas sediminis]|uniref:Uncharacterized protein n=1 Tax=Bradymonas sediminis TaxID=1548548 RepID=A0A2Z4FJM5_9DELT|nr:hypothetical protein DN745_07180 [Bradymonas sediminis]